MTFNLLTQKNLAALGQFQQKSDGLSLDQKSPGSSPGGAITTAAFSGPPFCYCPPVLGASRFALATSPKRLRDRDALYVDVVADHGPENSAGNAADHRSLHPVSADDGANRRTRRCTDDRVTLRVLHDPCCGGPSGRARVYRRASCDWCRARGRRAVSSVPGRLRLVAGRITVTLLEWSHVWLIRIRAICEHQFFSEFVDFRLVIPTCSKRDESGEHR